MKVFNLNMFDESNFMTILFSCHQFLQIVYLSETVKLN